MAKSRNFSQGEYEFACLLRSMDWPPNLPRPAKTGKGQEGYQYKFLPDRKWSFDFAWPDHKVALEVEGGNRTPGGHAGSGPGIAWKEMEKFNVAQLKGWIVLRVSPDMVGSWVLLKQIKVALEMRNPTIIQETIEGQTKIIKPLLVTKPNSVRVSNSTDLSTLQPKPGQGRTEP